MRVLSLFYWRDGSNFFIPLIVHTAIMASARRVRNIHQKLMPMATKSIVSSSNECDTPR